MKRALKIVGSLSLLLVACLFLFASNIKLAIFNAYLSQVFEEVNYKSLTVNSTGAIKASSLSITDPLLGQIFVPQAEITTAVSLWPLSLTLDIILDHPVFSLTNIDGLEKFLSQSAFLNPHMRLQANEGIISMGHYKVSVDGALDFNEPEKSSFSIKEGNTFNLSYENRSLNLECKDADCKALFLVIKPWFKQLGGLQMLMGKASGSLHISKIDSSLQEAKGSLELNDLALESVDGQFQVKIPKSYLEVDFHKKTPKLVIAQGSILENAELTLYPQGKDPYIFSIKEGTISVETIKTIQYQFLGKAIHNKTTMPFEASGRINLFQPGKEWSSLNLGFIYHQEAQAKAQIDVQELGHGWKGLSLHIGNITRQEFQFFKDLLVYFPIPLPELDFQEGTVGGVIKTHIYGDTIKDVSIDHIHFMDSHLALQDLCLKAKKVFVKGELNLGAKEPADSLTVHVAVSGGHISGKDPFNYTVDHCDGEAFLENGVLKKAKALGRFQGMDCKIDYDLAKCYGAKFNLKCPTDRIEKALPQNLKGLMQACDDDTIAIESVVKDKGDHYAISGKSDVTMIDHHKVLSGQFGFKISKLKKEDLSLNSLPIEEGFLLFENVDLQRFIAPWVFLDEEGARLPIDLKGTASIEGQFDSRGLKLSYEAKDVVMESDHFVMKVDKIFKNDLHYPSHFFSFLEDEHYGEIPIINGTYKDKFSALEFTDIACNVRLRPNKIHIGEIALLSFGLHFKGTIDVNSLSSLEKGAYNVQILTDEISGKAADLRNFANHLKSASYISYIPLDGDIRSGKGDCLIEFKVRQQGTEIASKIKGSLFEGSLPLDSKTASFRELGFNLSYESGVGLDISDIQGTLIVGGLKKAKEYFLHSDGITIDNLSTGAGKFNVWIEGSDHELFRFVGITQKGNEGIDMVPDISKTHFMGIHPDEFTIVLNSWDSLKALSFGMTVNLSQANGLESITSKLSDLFSISSSIKGFLKFNLSYNDRDDTLKFHTLFKDLSIGEKVFKEAEIKGAYKNKTLFVDHFLFDDLSLGVEIAKADQVWNVRFLGGSIKDKITFGIEGLIDEENQQILGKVRRFEVHPAALEYFYTDNAFDLNRIQGSLTGSGDFTIKKGTLSPFDFSLKLLLAGMTRIDNMNLVDIKPFALLYTKADGLSLKDFEAHLYRVNEEAKIGTVKLGKVATYSNDDGWNLNNITFSLKPKATAFFLKTFSSWFPLFKEPLFQEMLAIEDSYDGILSMTSKEGAYFLALGEGQIKLLGAARAFRNFSLEATRGSLRWLADFSVGSKWIRTRFVANDSQKNQGMLELSDPLKEVDDKIAINWKQLPGFSFEIVKAKGSVAGITLDLVQSKPDNDFSTMQGTIGVDTVKIAPYNSDGSFFKTSIQYLISGNFKFRGLIRYMPGDLSLTSIQGKLNVFAASIKDILINHIESDFSANHDRFLFENIDIDDPAGRAHIPEMMVSFKDQGLVKIPVLAADSIHPANIHMIDGQTFLKNRALKISDLKITDLSFSLKAPNLCVGKGWLKFSNTSKKLIQNTLFQIPREIITRLGLNPSVLTPVRGEIFFELGQEKIFITKLKDVFSEGKGSKFYLASKETPSYVDFKGNLMVQIRMKQYNILFKIAELITVTVKGNYTKPLYFLQKQE